ncbi:hypothetical protein ACFSCX_02740 [Bacillus salitolerans]|uniref:DUF2187 domain-containing protein n=1 Tax=Bacillus salitolerans TaxID=1437434 RepID=A0ABW4LKK9_9BACI
MSDCRKKHPFRTYCDKDCLCKLIAEYKGADVKVKTKSGDKIEGELEFVTKDCCVVIIEPELISPYLNKQVTIIRCKDIESFSADLYQNDMKLE